MEFNEKVKLLDAVERLQVNPDFILFFKSYTEEHVINLVDKLSGLVKEGESTDTIHEQLKAISLFKSYIKLVQTNGNSAKESIDGQEE